ncbi:MAG: class I SAM-dependent methyltransferase [Candidatus Heimdallarchaeota archaeon]
MSKKYYSEKLSANKLKRCYDLASPRIQQYLTAEIEYVLTFLKPGSIVLELGCGYGRVLKHIAANSQDAYGIDTSAESLELAEEYLSDNKNVKLFNMNADNLTFEENMFDVVFAIQNGLSAFKVDPISLVKQCLKITKKGGKIIFSSYSDKIWDERLDWFKKQSKEWLIGAIDTVNTGDGTIICKDGFQATTFSKSDFSDLSVDLEVNSYIKEIDQSSIFWVIYAD